MLGPLVGRGVEREGGPPVRARRAAEPEIDAARRQRVEHAEHLGHFERRIVRQHDAGAADPDALRSGGDRGDHDLRRGADDGRMVVMLGDPEPVVAQRLAVPGQRYGIADRLIVRAAGDGDRLIENGKTHYGDKWGADANPASPPSGTGRPAADWAS